MESVDPQSSGDNVEESFLFVFPLWHVVSASKWLNVTGQRGVAVPFFTDEHLAREFASSGPGDCTVHSIATPLEFRQVLAVIDSSGCKYIAIDFSKKRARYFLTRNVWTAAHGAKGDSFEYQPQGE